MASIFAANAAARSAFTRAFSAAAAAFFIAFLLITGFPSASTAGVSVAFAFAFAVVSFADMVAMRRRVESSAFSRVGRSSRVASTLASVLAR